MFLSLYLLQGGHPLLSDRFLVLFREDSGWAVL